MEASSATDDRRRLECLRTVTTLDDLHSELKNLRFSLSRSATYLRLLPRRGNTSEGYRHVQTVPVKLTRPENNLRKKNKDRMFAKSFMEDLINVSFLDLNQSFFSRMTTKQGCLLDLQLRPFKHQFLCIWSTRSDFLIILCCRATSYVNALSLWCVQNQGER